MHNPQSIIKDQLKSLSCFQINVQHSRAATSNLMQLIEEANIYLTYIQEPYTINNKIVGIPKRFRTYTCGNGRNRAAVVANNKELDIILLNQMSDKDCVVVEMRTNKIKFFATSM